MKMPRASFAAATRCLLTILAGFALHAVPCLAAPPGTISDEAQVPPFSLPNPLVCEDGTRVADAAAWKEKRRPELLRLFERNVYGKTLVERPAALRFVLREEKKDARGGKATRLRVGILFEGREDGRQMELLVYLPNKAAGPVPMFLGLNFDGNYSTTEDADLPLPSHWVNGLFTNRVEKHRPAEAGRGIHGELWQYDLALDNGYGVATAGYGEVQPDEAGMWKDGPRGLGPEPGAEDWGSLGAWAWALSRAMDYLETNPRVNPKGVAVIGFSRLGKAALWAGAQDERFAMVVSMGSGAGGAALSKRIFGETVENMTTRLGHWFCPSYGRYAGREADLPVDQHELLALIAPRPVLILSATEDLWSDPKGEFLSGVGADPVYRLLGTDGIAQKEWPEPRKLLTSRIGYYLRPGKHDVTKEDWQAMLDFARRHF
jgi:hypothetical protein